MFRQTVVSYLQGVISEMGGQPDKFRLEIPNQKGHGDYASNYCFIMAKPLKQSPKVLAEQLCDHINNQPNPPCELKATPLNGFVNISVSDHTLWTYFTHMLDQRPTYPEQARKVLLEFVSANPTGPLHIGHGRWAVLGDVIARLLTEVGVDVAREFYINDAGHQISLFYDSIQAIKAGQAVPEAGYHGAYIKTLSEQKEDPVQVILQQHKDTLAQIGVSFDTWFSEKSLHESDAIDDVLDRLKQHDLTYSDAGALWFKSTTLGDDKDRVLIKTDGKYTYFLVDIAYHYHKLGRGYTDLINLWGADHHGYINRMKAAVNACSDMIGCDTQFEVIIGQLVHLFRDGTPVRMSKRTGEIITLDEVVQEIGVDATRFFLIQKSADTHIDFDLSLAKQESSDNPVYYIQYAHARICSILRKVADLGIASPSLDNVTLDAPERDILIRVVQLYETLYDTALSYQPHHLAQYGLTLAKRFHAFYEQCPILKADPDTQCKRIHILNGVRLVTQYYFKILGISAPESM